MRLMELFATLLKHLILSRLLLSEIILLSMSQCDVVCPFPILVACCLLIGSCYQGYSCLKSSLSNLRM